MNDSPLVATGTYTPTLGPAGQFRAKRLADGSVWCQVGTDEEPRVGWLRLDLDHADTVGLIVWDPPPVVASYTSRIVLTSLAGTEPDAWIAQLTEEALGLAVVGVPSGVIWVRPDGVYNSEDGGTPECPAACLAYARFTASDPAFQVVDSPPRRASSLPVRINVDFGQGDR